jgi:hypothetical protein
VKIHVRNFRGILRDEVLCDPLLCPAELEVFADLDLDGRREPLLSLRVIHAAVRRGRGVWIMGVEVVGEEEEAVRDPLSV